jgi:hypothetical protein
MMEDIEKLGKLQEDAIVQRVTMQQQRRKMNNHRNKIHKWDGELLKLYQENATGTNVDSSKAADLLQKAQAARNRLGPVQDKYEQADLSLGELEIEITELIEKIMQRYSRYSELIPGQTETSSEDSVRSSSSSIEFEDDPTAEFIRGVPFYNASEVGSNGPFPDDRTYRRRSSLQGDPIFQEAFNNAPVKLHSVQYTSEEALPSAFIPWQNGSTFLVVEKADGKVSSGADIESIAGWKQPDEMDQIRHESVSEGTTVVPDYDSIYSTMEVIREATKQRGSMSRVNEWILQNLLSSALQWIQFEYFLHKALPPGATVQPRLWEEDFIKLWDSDDEAMEEDQSRGSSSETAYYRPVSKPSIELLEKARSGGRTSLEQYTSSITYQDHDISKG